MKIAQSNIENVNKNKVLNILNLGGDEELSYENILKKIKTKLTKNDSS